MKNSEKIASMQTNLDNWWKRITSTVMEEASALISTS